MVVKKSNRKRGKKGWHRLGLPVGKPSKVKSKSKKKGEPMYTTERISLLLSKRDKSLYDKIKETLKMKSREELLAICENEVFPFMNPFIRARMSFASDTELIDAIADMRLLRMKPPTQFDVKRYYDNLFKGRQKGRAYRSFWEH